MTDRILNLLSEALQQDAVDDICNTFLEGLPDVIQLERAAVFLLQSDGRTFRGKYAVDAEGHTSRIGDEQQTMWGGEPLVDRLRDVDVLEPEAADEAGAGALVIALRSALQLCGFLLVRVPGGGMPSEEDLHVLSRLSRILGPTMEVAQVRAALDRSEERFTKVAAMNAEWIWELDATGCYTYCSPVASEILGHRIEDLIGHPMIDFVAPGDRDRMRDTLALVRAEGKRSDRVSNTHLHKDGHIVNFQTCCIPRLTPGGAFLGFLGTHRDMTREIHLEEELRHSQKMDAIGRLAGGVAHDFNNLLTVILGCSRLIRDEMEETDPLYEDLSMIQASGERAALLTKQLLAFGRKQILFIKRCNVHRVIGDMEDLLRRTLSEDIDLRIETEPNLPDIEADADQLQQVVLHLAVNAQEAMVDPRPYYQPELWSTNPQNREPRTKQLSVLTVVERDPEEGRAPRVVLTVSDTGVGMPEDVRQHVFEPFFTTKAVGEGSGLGLPTVYGIVTQMNGEIEIDSVPGEGTTVRIFFAPADQELAVAPPKVETTGELGGDERLLIVEDNATVRKLMVRMLTSHGYSTEEAPNGRTALEMSGQWGDDPPQLVLTDMVMPEMTGRQLVEKLRETRPDVRVLFMSGYSREEMVAEDVVHSDAVFLQKPFSREDLLRKVRNLLDS